MISFFDQTGHAFWVNFAEIRHVLVEVDDSSVEANLEAPLCRMRAVRVAGMLVISTESPNSSSINTKHCLGSLGRPRHRGISRGSNCLGPVLAGKSGQRDEQLPVGRATI